MQPWLLPDSVEDLLPAQARQFEAARARLLETFRRSGYELVVPPLIEFVESLMVSSANSLDIRTFRLVDRESGRGMGVRADITPQVARIDAHVLARPGVTRLCYCGSVLHAIPRDVMAAREPTQIGAELYGHSGVEADYEVIRLMAESLSALDIPADRIDLGHAGIFRALVAQARLESDIEKTLFDAMQAKDRPAIGEILAAVEGPVKSALMALPSFCGGIDALERAVGQLAPLEVPEVSRSLDDILRLTSMLDDLPLTIDLSDMHSYEYHSGVVFAAYRRGEAAAIAMGGRYDGIGARFGRARPATGFSMDLRSIARMGQGPVTQRAILAPFPDDADAREQIATLRSAGEVVVVALPGENADWIESRCDRQLVRDGNEWRIDAMGEQS